MSSLHANALIDRKVKNAYYVNIQDNIYWICQTQKDIRNKGTSPTWVRRSSAGYRDKF